MCDFCDRNRPTHRLGEHHDCTCPCHTIISKAVEDAREKGLIP